MCWLVALMVLGWVSDKAGGRRMGEACTGAPEVEQLQRSCTEESEQPSLCMLMPEANGDRGVLLESKERRERPRVGSAS